MPKTNKKAPTKLGVKKQVLTTLFKRCQKRESMVFDNDELNKLCQERKTKFRNPHDAVKIDNKKGIPPVMLEHDYFLVHLGKGRHQFVQGIDRAFHRFEAIPENNVISWKYRKSVLNEVNDSESNILSVAANQRILHDFLYDDIDDTVPRTKIYNAHRTQKSLSYIIGNVSVETESLQMEIDMTCEMMGRVTIIEGKNGFPEDFAVYQIFHPYLYYSQLKEEKNLDIKTIDCCYVLRQDNDKGITIVRMYLYEFRGNEMTSIALKKCAEYRVSPK